MKQLTVLPGLVRRRSSHESRSVHSIDETSTLHSNVDVESNTATPRTRGKNGLRHGRGWVKQKVNSSMVVTLTVLAILCVCTLFRNPSREIIEKGSRIMRGLSLDVGSDYECIAERCNYNMSIRCRCGSPTAPVLDMPQFIVISHQGPISTMPTWSSINLYRMALAHRNSHNNCSIPITWFLARQFSHPNLVRSLWESNHEIAVYGLSSADTYVTGDVRATRDWLRDEIGIPERDIKGFRAPHQVHSPNVRRDIHELGLQYDSTIAEVPGSSPMSIDASSMIFPYTLDYGIAQPCLDGVCMANESYPGLWEIPLYVMNAPNSSTMQVQLISPSGNIYDILVDQLERRIHGNRAPLGIYVDSSWLGDAAIRDQVQRFISEMTTTRDDVFFVSNIELIEFMMHPMSLDEYRERARLHDTCTRSRQTRDNDDDRIDAWMGPQHGCGSGVWDADAQICRCTNETSLERGYCRDNITQTCRIEKVWNPRHNGYICTYTMNMINGSSGGVVKYVEIPGNVLDMAGTTLVTFEEFAYGEINVISNDVGVEFVGDGVVNMSPIQQMGPQLDQSLKVLRVTNGIAIQSLDHDDRRTFDVYGLWLDVNSGGEQVLVQISGTSLRGDVTYLHAYRMSQGDGARWIDLPARNIVELTITACCDISDVYDASGFHPIYHFSIDNVMIGRTSPLVTPTKQPNALISRAHSQLSISHSFIFIFVTWLSVLWIVEA